MPLVSGVRHRRKTTEEFIADARSVHPDAPYDYSQVRYAGAKVKVQIICAHHGPFLQAPNYHLTGCGCPRCGATRRETAKRYSLETFLKKARETHPDARYDYSLVDYRGSRVPVRIVCPVHGEFEQNPVGHLTGRGCMQCGIQRRNAAISGNQAEFMDAARSTHGDRYSYDKVDYQGFHRPIIIVCPEHGEFKQKPAKHLAGQGCPACGLVKLSLDQRESPEDFIARCQALHGADRYDYSNARYVTSQGKVEIICPKPGHGSFWQLASDHVAGHGCPTCVHIYSSPHKEIEAWVAHLNVEYQSNTRSLIAPYELDIFCPSSNLAIEFNGSWWHSQTDDRTPGLKNRHLRKFQLCREKGIRLLQIDEHEWKDPIRQVIWKSILASRLGKQDRIPARKTIFRPISREDATQFLQENHLQGKTPGARWCFGLYHSDLLVGVITFAGHQKRYLNLTRLAFRRDLTVVGGATKLFRNALRMLPDRDVVTFSNNQYSGGDVYRSMGFDHAGDLPPSYQWLYRNRVWNKRLLRHSRLPEVLGSGYNSAETEHQNLYRNGARCLYDAGYQRWVFHRNELSASLNRSVMDAPPPVHEARP